VLTRKGTVTTISYDVSQFQVRSPCDTILNGQGQINTKKNELSAHVSGTENCNSSEQWVTGTKEPI
jgi:hypothetical protein